MEALKACYGSSSDSDSSTMNNDSRQTLNFDEVERLPLPPASLLDPHSAAYSQIHGNRVRSFPHVEGNYALHVFVPVHVPPLARKELAPLLRKVASLVPCLHAIDVDIPLNDLCQDDQKLDQILLGREFHISLSRTVPIRVHQIDSIVAMLRQKFQAQRRYWIEFGKWEVFVNDEQSRTFLSMEVNMGGLSEIIKQIQAVNEVYRLHNLPEFYKNPRPHVSLAWALGDIRHSLQRSVIELNGYHMNASSLRKNIWACRFNRIECKIGKKSYRICKIPAQ